MSDEPERYSEEEVGLILRRAAEIQAGRSMTLAELEAAATEAGIEGALIRRAAVELRTRREPESLELSGLFGPTRLAYERRVEGAIRAPHWDEILAEIRRRLGNYGLVGQQSKELVWQSKKLSGEAVRDIRVSVFARRGHTVISVEERTGGLAGGLYGGIMGGGLGAGVGWIVPVCIAALGVPQLIPVFLALWVAGTWYLARSIQRAVLRNRHQELTALADGLQELCGELAGDQ
jgi:hypothetical protein